MGARRRVSGSQSRIGVNVEVIGAGRRTWEIRESGFGVDGGRAGWLDGLRDTAQASEGAPG